MSDGPILSGVEYDVRTDRKYRYTQQSKDFDGPDSLRVTGDEANNRTDQQPSDRAAALVRVYDAATFLEDEQAKTPVAYPTMLSLGNRLPPKLNSVKVTFNKSGGSGTSDHLAANMSIVILNAGSGSLDPKSSAQASASIVPAVTWDIDIWHQEAEVDAVEYEFTDAPGLTNTQIFARLLAQNTVTVLALPVFKRKSIQFVLKGSQLSLQQSADTQASIAVNLSSATQSSSQSKGNASSYEQGVNIRVETSPYALYGDLTLTSASDSQSISVTVKANVPNLPSTGTPIITAIENEPAALTGSADGSVTFANGTTTQAGTTPNDIPRTGKYMVVKESSQDELGTVKYRITVVDFAQYA